MTAYMYNYSGREGVSAKAKKVSNVLYYFMTTHRFRQRERYETLTFN